MRFYLISDNIDTQIGMRLAGIEGVVVHEPDEVKEALLKACGLNDVGIVLMTEKLIKLIPDLVYDIKLNQMCIRDRAWEANGHFSPRHA